MPGDWDQCCNTCDGFNCHEECSGDGCIKMGTDNCKTAPNACFVCPCTYACYGTLHCMHCVSRCVRVDKPPTADDIRQDIYMVEHDEICGDNYFCGCLCCPIFLSTAALSFVGVICAWFGSATCCGVGCCLLCCKSCKSAKCGKDNAVGPSDNASNA